MIRKLADWLAGWLAGWRATLEIKRNNPELYAFLCSDESRDPANYTEVGPPGEGRVFIHGSALETLRGLGEESQP